MGEVSIGCGRLGLAQKPPPYIFSRPLERNRCIDVPKAREQAWELRRVLPIGGSRNATGYRVTSSRHPDCRQRRAHLWRSGIGGMQHCSALCAKYYKATAVAISSIAHHPRCNRNWCVAVKQRVYSSCRIIAPAPFKCRGETHVFTGVFVDLSTYEFSNEAFNVENAVVCSIPRFGPKERHISHGPQEGSVGNRCRRLS